MGLDPKLMAQLGIKRASDLDSPDGPPAELPWNEGVRAERAELSEQGEHGEQGKSRAKRAPGERSDRSILQQHRENRIASGTLRVPQVRVSGAGRRGGDGPGDEFAADEAGGPGDPDGGTEGYAGVSGAEGRGGRGGRGRQRGPGKSGKASRASKTGKTAGRRGNAERASAQEAGEPVSDELAAALALHHAPAAPDWADVGAPPAWATQGELPERVTAILSDWDRKEAEAAELIAARVEVLPETEAAPRAQVVDLSDEEAEQLARAICLRLLTAMPRTRFELERTLQERDVPAAAAQSVLDRYEELGIIDDGAFAAAWVESRARSKGFARGRLKQELRRKGVDGEPLETALSQIDSDQERERAEELALRKLGSRPLPPASGYGTPDAAERDKVLRRVIGFLARKGYPGGMAMSAARSAMERHDAGER